MGWLVVKNDSPLGEPLQVYLRHPRRNGFEGWDERHDAMVFDSWFAAAWQAIRHLAWVTRSGSVDGR